MEVIIGAILIALSGGWCCVNVLMPKADLTSRAQRLTIIAIILVYGVFVLAAFVGHLNKPSGFNFTKFLMEGVLVGALAGAVTCGVGQTIHWAITGKTMKGITPPPKEKVEPTKPTAASSHKNSESISTAGWLVIMGLFGILGNSMTLFGIVPAIGTISVSWWLLLMGFGIVFFPAIWIVTSKHRSGRWLLFSIIPLGWIVLIALKSHKQS